MLGWLLLGAIFAAAVITITVTYLNKAAAKRKLAEKEIWKGSIKEILQSDSVTHIKLDAITDDGSEVEVDFETEDYDSDEIYEGAVIYS